QVLLLPDTDAGGSATLANAMRNAGMAVTIAPTPAFQYTGKNPASAGFDTVVILSGDATSSKTDMAVGGQQEVVDFVAGGGGLVLSEWAAFQVASGRWQTLKPLVLLGRAAATTGNIDYTV